MAVISNKKKGVHLDLNKRRSFRHTFGSTTVEKLSPLIEKILNQTDLPKFKIDPTHGDVLGYQGHPDNPGHFGLHRDSKNPYPFEERKTKYSKVKEYPFMFTFVLILSCDTAPPSEFEQGGTQIWSLPANTLDYYKYGRDTDVILGKKLKSHLSPAIHRQFVVFPSNALHQSLPIYNPNRFKLALKMDLWVKNLRVYNFSYSYFLKDCKCSQCDPFSYPTKKEIARFKPQEYLGLILTKKLPLELTEYICSFLVKKTKTQVCDYSKNCSCLACVEYEVEEREYFEDDDDDFCNGYDDYY